MQANATVQQQQQYQKKLLQQQQQQMSQFQSPAPLDPGSIMVQSPIQMTGGMVPPPPHMTPRQQSTMSSTSRMGPPPITIGQAGAGSMITQQISPLPASESATYFGPGAGLARLHQYAEGLKEGPDRQTSEYWKAFVDEFYLPTATMHLVLWNPSTREHKGFEVPAAVVSRWMQTNYISGVTSTNISMENPREYLSGQPFPPPPRSIRADFHLPSGSVTHFVESKRALLISNFDNGWQVQMTGLVRAAFVPHTKLRSLPNSTDSPTVQTHLRLECLEILIINHRSYVPSGVSLMQAREEQIPQRVVRSILAANGHDDTRADSKKSSVNPTDDLTSPEEEEKSDFSISVNQVCLPESPVNEYGITLRAMRCLEITESVCQLRDLMDFSTREKDKQAGPIEGLRRLTAQYRAGAVPNNALQFDFNPSPASLASDQNKMGKKRSQQSDSAAGTNGANETDASGNTNGNNNVRQGPGPSPKLSMPKRQRG